MLQPTSVDGNSEDANGYRTIPGTKRYEKTAKHRSSASNNVPWQSQTVSNCKSIPTESITSNPTTAPKRCIFAEEAKLKTARRKQRGGPKTKRAYRKQELVCVIPARLIKTRINLTKTLYDLQGWGSNRKSYNTRRTAKAPTEIIRTHNGPTKTTRDGRNKHDESL